MKVPKELRGPEGDALRPTDLGDDQELGATLTAIEDFPGKDGPVYFVARFDEFPGKYLRLNKTSIGRLIAGFKSDDTDEWRGKITLEKVKTEDPRKEDERGKETVLSVWIAAHDSWPEKPKARKATARAR